MEYLKHQIKYGKKLKKKLLKRGYVYLISPPRAGKTLTALYAVENINQIENILVISPKNAHNGWAKFINSPLISKNYKIVNIESLHKINTDKFNVVILDECHKYGGLGKQTVRHKIAKEKLKNLPQILISATPFVESKNNIYYQTTKSKYNPFRKFKSFYDFFRFYGVQDLKYFGGRNVESYKKSNDKLDKLIDKISVVMPKVFKKEAIDKIIYIDINKYIKELYNTILNDNYLKIGKYEFSADTTMRLRLLLHQLEGGTIKDDEGNIYEIPVKYNAKLQYLLDNYKDSNKLGIMCHFKAERDLLAKYFKKAGIYSSNAHAEGVDLSHLENFIIYSQDYSGAKHIQRRDRIVNINGSATLIVTHLLVKKAISEQVYKICNKKKDFNNETFKKIEIS